MRLSAFNKAVSRRFAMLPMTEVMTIAGSDISSMFSSSALSISKISDHHNTANDENEWEVE